MRKDGGPDGRGVGFYFRNVTELVLFGVRGKNARTLPPGRRQVNIIKTMKREHSRKPDELYDLIEAYSPEPRLEMFARGTRKKWKMWGDQAHDDYMPTWATNANHSRSGRVAPTGGSAQLDFTAKTVGETTATIACTGKATYTYRVVVELDEDAWHAWCPTLQGYGAATWGRTRAEALRQIREVVAMIVSELVEDGETLPANEAESVGTLVSVTV